MKIVHVFRAPVGGLFRHVSDLARGQSELGHEVGIVCDSTTGGEYAAGLLTKLEKYCSLGVERHPISRLPGIGDVLGAQATIKAAGRMKPDVLHGHGAKGGAYARLAAWRLGKRSFYTPHGGSLHHDARFPMSKIILGTEKMLNRIGTGVCFVCHYEKKLYEKLVGLKGKPSVVVHNGLWPEEFSNAQPNATATDFLFIGEMRDFKGVDILLHALAKLPGATLTAVGDGPELNNYRALAGQLGIAERAHFAGRMPMAQAAKLGRIMVLPSRFESFPYVVLETAAAGLPLITTAVGGIAEVVPQNNLCIPLDADTLAEKMKELRADSQRMHHDAHEFAAHIKKACAACEMTRKITDFYQSA